MIRTSRVIIFLLCMIHISWLDPYRDRVSDGNTYFHDKKYEDAKKSYKSAEDYAPGTKDKQRLSFNKGDADYMIGDYDNAITNFQKSIQSGDKDVQKKAFFNIGNAYMKQGKYKEAIQSFINALKIDPDYENAKKNIEYILKKKEQEKNQKENKEGKGGDSKSGKDKQKDKDKKKDDKNKKGQQGKMSKEQLKKILEYFFKDETLPL